jgi:hypothetical protein
MDKLGRTLEEYLSAHSSQLSLIQVVLNLCITAILSFILSKVYERYGHSLSNRKLFARNFLMISMTTMLIITIVKSSLALSLGLVGALSIVRFRTAIKEPEELAFLLINIAIGLGLGADQVLITTAAFVILMIVIIIRGVTFKKEENQNLLLSMTVENPGKKDLESIIAVLKQNCDAVDLRRFDTSKTSLEAVFTIDVADYNKVQDLKNALEAMNDSIRISFLGSHTAP